MRLSLSSLTNESVLNQIMLFPTAVPKDGIVFDFGNVRFCTPLGMLLFGSALKRYRKGHPDRYFAVSRYEKMGYAATMGFFKYISPAIPIGKAPGEAPGSATYSPITLMKPMSEMREMSRLGKFIEMGDVIEESSKKLAKIISPSNRQLEKILSYIFRELIRNTPEHSGKEDVWVCAQAWGANNTAEVAVLDEGSGVWESLRANPIHGRYVDSDEEALRWAVKPGVSKAFAPSKKSRDIDQWSNSGFGLYMVSELCSQLGGTFTLVSGKAFLEISPNGVKAGKTNFDGTAISVKLPTGVDANAEELIRKIAKKGELEARTIRGAFKEASVPSKTLMF